MNLNIKSIVLIAVAAILVAGACKKGPDNTGTTQTAEKPEPPAVHSFSVNGSVREMSIGLENPKFPDGPGKQEFMSYCAMCHSLRYISMQPSFPRKTWEAEVTKMVVNYKAPIDSVTCNKIIDYLASVSTNKE